jgi:2-polyprenyl-3-methyl-5-hydroxy-6-metoxy-1,4-benzoquinol methylase
VPTSYLDNVPAIVKIVQRLQPATVLDVGIGMGKYGLLVREYLSGDTGKSQVSVDGIEGFEGYLTDAHRGIYDEIFVTDLREFDFRSAHYDLYLMIDVLEHVTKDEGHRLLRDIAGTVLISTPKIDHRAHYEHNPLEDHQSHWTVSDFEAYRYEDFSNQLATIVVIST